MAYLPLFGQNLEASSSCESRSTCMLLRSRWMTNSQPVARQRLHSVSWIGYGFRLLGHVSKVLLDKLFAAAQVGVHTRPFANCEPVCFQSIVLMYLQIEAPKPHCCRNTVYLSKFAYLAIFSSSPLAGQDAVPLFKQLGLETTIVYRMG